ncbi:MAG: hypothetical protein WBQ18_04270 [Solirubrobacteraceae bacterium]
MPEHQTSRTLVKSAPELWAECSDAASLARHLGAFGEIRITKLEPETAVAWEGTAASGTVRLETAGWGTRVTLTVVEEEPSADEPAADAPAAVDDESVAVAEPEPAAEPQPEPEPAAEPQPEPELEAQPEPEPVAEGDVVADAGPVADLEPPRRGFFARLFAGFRTAPESARTAPAAPDPQPEPDPEAASDVEPEPEAAPTPPPALLARPPAPPPLDSDGDSDSPAGELALAAALDSLGRAHHRPYSRA